MCGRFTITVTMDELKEYLSEYYDIDEMKSSIVVPRYNVAPGQEVISIINDGSKNRVGLLKWGFVPSFAKDNKLAHTMINARSEMIHEKKAYRPSLEHKRCVILANGFYEWKNTGEEKIPMRILMKNHSLFPIAGLWSSYVKRDGTKEHTCTIITTQANDIVSQIHNRMPVILNEEDRKTWLNPNIKDYNLVTPLLKPFLPERMYAYQVSTKVNSALNEIPECIEPIV